MGLSKPGEDMFRSYGTPFEISADSSGVYGQNYGINPYPVLPQTSRKI
jgi:hypothetical protein